MADVPTAETAANATTRRITPAVWLATSFGVTLSTPAPGTVGAAIGIGVWLVIQQLPGGLAAHWAAIAALVAAGGPLCGQAAADLARTGRVTDAKDPQAITWDELATMPIVYAAAPDSCGCATWVLGGFALHRLFDITKPWPCRVLERLPGGWGIMADDVAAAAYAAIVYAIAWRVGGA
ncbi:MAG: phosphatidylglycerophosphatase A [Planctomycetota bacterium]